MLRSLRHTLAALTRWELRLLAVLAAAFALSFAILLWQFYYANTQLQPTTGGTYIEGSVGDLQPLNPWFTVRNDVNRDIVSLVFSGLLKYDPQTKKIIEDLATMKVSEDGKIYTLRLKDDLFWHDSTPEAPHPVTADDVLFTFKTIQDPQFPNSLLRQNFQGVEIELVDARTVQFKLSEPYSFFPSNLTLGLVPQKSFEGIPARKMDQALDFAFAPVGAGPYKFKSVVQTEFSTEVTLERFERGLPPTYLVERIVFRIFPSYNVLLSDVSSLDGIRLVPRNDKNEPVVPKKFEAINYTLPQYVALFFNMDRAVLQNRKLRLGLQLGTNKRAIVEDIGETKVIDTPLLEVDAANWAYQYDVNAAQGALFETKWYLPEKVRLQHLLEERETNSTGPLRFPPVVFMDTGAVLTMTGSTRDVPPGARVNGIQLQPLPNRSGSWIVGLPTFGGTGALKIGRNLVRLTDPSGKVVDSAYVTRAAQAEEFKILQEEQRLLDSYLQTRDNQLASGQEPVTAASLFLENGRLRLRRGSDPPEIRINDAGQRLQITLLTSASPPAYKRVAELVKAQWLQLGVDVKIDIPPTHDEFEQRLLTRDYDVLLFGQSLLDNLDSYPYWHSSGVQKVTGNRNDLRLDAYNLSQYASFESDALLETIRETGNEDERREALRKLQIRFGEESPAVILYSPVSIFAYNRDISGLEVENLSLHSDRFLTLHRWYMKQERVFQPGRNWLSFVPWMFGLLHTAKDDEATTFGD